MGMPEMDHHKNNPQISTKEQSNTVEQRQSFQKIGLNILDTHIQETKT